MYRELLLGCGNNRSKKMCEVGKSKDWTNLTTLDIARGCQPDVVHDLEVFPYPFADNTFDEIHAYEVLEHTGSQGDWKFFFDQFAELHRILKPGGLLFATVPAWNSVWALGDPSHKRVLSNASLTFLSQAEYRKQVGSTSMTDFRFVWDKDFKAEFMEYKGENFSFVLRAIKNDNLSGHRNNNVEQGESI